MATEKRLDLIDRNDLIKAVEKKRFAIADNTHPYEAIRIQGKYFREVVDNAPTVDAVEVPDKELLKAIKLLIKQYEHSKQSDYVHSPVAHALYRTWKQMDERRE